MSAFWSLPRYKFNECMNLASKLVAFYVSETGIFTAK